MSKTAGCGRCRCPRRRCRRWHCRRRRPRDAESPPRLTRRERDVLRLLAESRTDREIAEALFLSPRTVNWHVRGVLAKLGAVSRHEAVARAQAEGLISPENPRRPSTDNSLDL
jgi:DNA-binding CsgD family transcriptional regulator